MMPQLMQTAVVARDKPPETPCYVDGVAVESLFEDIYVSVKGLAESNEVTLRFEVIAWEPLFAAADPCLLRDVLYDLTAGAIDATHESRVALRAFPSHDDVCVTFQVAVEESGPHNVRNPDTWNEALLPARACIARMGGEQMVCRRAQDGACFWFRLPQWVTGDIEYASAAWRKAA